MCPLTINRLFGFDSAFRQNPKILGKKHKIGSVEFNMGLLFTIICRHFLHMITTYIFLLAFLVC